MSESWLILPDWLITTPTVPPRRGWGVRIVADQITAVAPHAELRTRYPEDPIWEAPGQVLAPGFVNAHTHLYGVLAHGIPLTQAPAGFWPFLQEFWWPHVEDRLNHALICAATDLQCARLLLGGVTTFYDCTEAPYALPGVLAAQAEVVQRHGNRAILSFEATERVSPANGQLGLQENSNFIQQCRSQCPPAPGRSAPPLLSGLLCFHTTFTCSAAFIRQAFALAREYGTLVHAHVSEGLYEPEYNLAQHGVRTIAYYNRLGLLGPDFLASQGVQVNAEEIALLAAHGVRVVHMPLSNCEVGGGIAPLPELIAAGITVGLGSDGYVDDFFEVMRGAFLIHKATHLDPQLMPAALVWYLATEGGARALGLPQVGRLEPGWQADLQLIDATLPTPLTADNLYDQLLLHRNAHDVRAVWVAGRLRVQAGLLVAADLAELIAHAHEAAHRLWSGAA